MPKTTDRKPRRRKRPSKPAPEKKAGGTIGYVLRSKKRPQTKRGLVAQKSRKGRKVEPEPAPNVDWDWTATGSTIPEKSPDGPESQTAEEPEALKQSEMNNAWTAYRNAVGGHRILTREEEQMLGKAIQGKSAKKRDEAIQTLVANNLKLVIAISNEFQGYGMEAEDLASEGNIGLHKAAERFNPKFGAKFSTYASWWIKQAMRRALSNQSRTIRLPVHLQDKLSKIRRITAGMSAEMGRDPTEEEVADVTGLKVETVRRLLSVEIKTLPLDSPIQAGESGSETFGEVIADPNAVMPDLKASHNGEMERVKTLLNRLPKRERQIIFDRFGLTDGDSKTLEEIGERYGVTRERIRQLEGKTLRFIRREITKMPAPKIEKASKKEGEKPESQSEPEATAVQIVPSVPKNLPAPSSSSVRKAMPKKKTAPTKRGVAEKSKSKQKPVVAKQVAKKPISPPKRLAPRASRYTVPLRKPEAGKPFTPTLEELAVAMGKRVKAKRPTKAKPKVIAKNSPKPKAKAKKKVAPAMKKGKTKARKR
jgi:RNA polymerase primary sigma factor